jgi:RNA polymerase sigma factor (sigma-70 family)
LQRAAQSTVVESRAGLDDEALVASRNDGERFDLIFELRAREIWRYLAGRLGPGVADELLSEVFVRAFAARSRFDPNLGTARGWLYGIANNLCRERLRSDSHYGRLPQGERTAQVAKGPDPADSVVERHMLRRSIDLLPDERREVILLIAAVGLSYEEAARALAVPVGTVRSRFFRARRQLRALLQDERSVDNAQWIP